MKEQNTVGNGEYGIVCPHCGTKNMYTAYAIDPTYDEELPELFKNVGRGTNMECLSCGEEFFIGYRLNSRVEYYLTEVRLENPDNYI